MPRPPTPDEAEPELRRVTVLFADIQGSTELIQKLDPETAAELIDPVLRAMIDAAERYDGTVSGRGDGIMAIFGAPSASEDHGMRACLAALAIREALPGDGGVRVRVGIHAGDVVFRPVRIGRGWSQDAVGVAVHIAARLEQSAAPGTICLSGAVWRLARGFVNVAPLEPIQVKGVDSAVERFLLQDAARSADRWAVRAASGLATFVDRVRELPMLLRALGERGLRLMHVVGSAGLGKSRLLHEFLGSEPARRCHVVNLVGDRHYRSVPFHPVSIWLRGWLDIRSTDSLEESRQKLGRGTAALSLLGEADRELLLRLLGLGAQGSDMARLDSVRKVDFGATIARLIRVLGGGRQTVLVCEDIDNFDPASRELLDSTLGLLDGHDVLVVTASRARVRLRAVPASVTRTLTLAPLPDPDSAVLLTSIDAGLAGNAELAAAILRKAGGNPLFLEEVAPLMAASPAGMQDEIAIPDRVEALIADRLAVLPRPLRRLVQLCAVIGTDVPLRLAAALAELPEAEMHRQMLKLQSEQVMHESRRYPDPQFSFKHALTRDVAYRTLLAARRRDCHARIVALLESEDAATRERHLDDLCLHAIQAQLWPQAVRYLVGAAGKALERAAFQPAADYLTRALDIVATLPDDDEMARTRLQILIGLRGMYGLADQHEKVETILDEAEPLARRLGDSAAQVRILGYRVHMLNITGRLEEAIALGDRMRGLARQDGNAELMRWATFNQGQSLYNLGRLIDSEEMLSEIATDTAAPEGIAMATPAGSLGVLVHGTRAMTRAFLADFPGALGDLAAAAALAETTGRAYDHMFAQGSAGFVQLQRRDATAAQAGFQESLVRADAAGISQLRAPVMAGLGHALLMAGELEAASAMLSNAHRMTRASRRFMYQVSAALGLALAGLRLGEPDLARRFADEALEMTERMGFTAYRVMALRTHGLVLAATAGLEDEGIAQVTASLLLAERLKMAADVAHAHAALAAAGQPAHLDEAGRGYAALGMEEWFTLLRAEITAGRVPYL